MQQDLFKGQKRKMRLKGWSPKMNSQNEPRLKLDFALMLTGQPTVGMPSEIMAAFDSVSTLDNAINHSNIESVPVPQTIEIYATDKSPRRMHLLTAAELQGLSVSRPKTAKGDENQVELFFTITVPADDDLCIWALKHNRKTFWAEFTPTQGVLRQQAKAEKENPQPTLLQSPQAKAAADSTPTNGGRRKARSGKEAAAGDREEVGV